MCVEIECSARNTPLRQKQGINGRGNIINPYFEASRDLPFCLDQSTAEPGINHLALAAKFYFRHRKSSLSSNCMRHTTPFPLNQKTRMHMSILNEEEETIMLLALSAQGFLQIKGTKGHSPDLMPV